MKRVYKIMYFLLSIWAITFVLFLYFAISAKDVEMCLSVLANSLVTFVFHLFQRYQDRKNESVGDKLRRLTSSTKIPLKDFFNKMKEND